MKRMSVVLIVILLLSFGCSAQAGWVTLTLRKDYATSLFPDPNVNPDEKCCGDFTYVVLDDGTVKITAYTGSETQLVLPRTLDGYVVTSIGERAFAFSKVSDIVCPESLRTIEAEAFMYSDQLSRVELNEGLLSIGRRAFFSCESLSNVQLPVSLASIGEEAFLFTVYENVTAQESAVNPQQDAGKERCAYCIGGWNECRTCGTFGYCSSCEGFGGQMVYTAYGWEHDDCNACGGSGACRTCGYSGFLLCNICNGTGLAN